MISANPRWIALQVMLQVVDRGRSLDDVFADSWYQSLTATRRDLALSRELVFGMCRWYCALSALLARRLQKPLRERDRDIEIILLLGLYQLLIIKTEAHAAVNETVKLVLPRKKAWARGLVNAVLRAVVREKVSLDDDAQAQAYPSWVLARIHRDWGEQADQLLIEGNQRPPMTLRADTRQTARDDLLDALRSDGIEARKHESIATAIELASPCDVTQLGGFEQGILSVQDAAAQIAASLLVCSGGERVLDACAAPGGKTAHLLQAYDDIELDALDSNERRLERVRQNLLRIDKSARILVGDAAGPDSWFSGRPYDCILADVPCSASGVIRRHPDIKLLRRESDIMPILAQQRKILDALWCLLKPGGRILYSTCSIFKDENETQIAQFLDRHPDGSEVTQHDALWGEPRPHGRQILTGCGNMDGFYYALLTKAGHA